MNLRNSAFKRLIRFFLRLHNFSYRMTSRFAPKLEDDLHPKHRLTKYHSFFVRNIDKNAYVLDIGCGNGSLTYDIAKKAAHVVGIDIDEGNIKTAQNKFAAFNVQYDV